MNFTSIHKLSLLASELFNFFDRSRKKNDNGDGGTLNEDNPITISDEAGSPVIYLTPQRKVNIISHYFRLTTKQIGCLTYLFTFSVEEEEIL